MLDLHTFGRSKAAAHLVHRLNELNNPYVTRYVTNFLIGRNRLVNALTEMPDRAARLTFANMLKDNINAARIKDAPTIIETLSKNVAMSALKARVLCEPEYDPEDYHLRVTSGSEFDFEDGEP